jgi:LuxR family maltose regulon positive regulatory protein
VITAPAGYGKTSHATAWVRLDHRPVAWIDIEGRHDDPAVLLADLVEALREVTDFGGDDLDATRGGPDGYATRVAVALGRAVRRCSAPFVVVLDDIHVLQAQPAMDLVDALISNVPEGSSVLMVGRALRSDAMVRARGELHVTEVHAEDLALDAVGVTQVLTSMEVDANDAEVARILEATEGWPVGVRLAGLASRAAIHAGSAPTLLTGRETHVHEYLTAEWLWDLSEVDRDFLVHVSVLDWLSGPLCNEVLGRHDAGEVLHRIAAERHLVIPLDQRASSYRMHHLLRDALESELERRDEAAARRTHQRASAWYEAADDIDRAIRHAVAAGDLDRAEQLVVTHSARYYTKGLFATIRSWIDSIPRDRVVRNPELALCAALAALGLGDAATLNTWLRVADHAVGSASEQDRLARLCLLDLRSTTSQGPVGQALDDALTAHQGLPPGIWHAASCLACGAWSWMRGDAGAAAFLVEGAAEAAVFGATSLEAQCAALLALMAHVEGDRRRASELASHAGQVAARAGLEAWTGMAIVHAVRALAAAQLGDPDAAHLHWARGRSHLAGLRDLSGWANVQTRLALAHASLLLGDRIGAETMLREAREMLVQQPDAAGAHRQVAALDALVHQLRRHESIGSSALTTSELRVLHYLPTNLTLAEIAARLYVSRYTVKTHCGSIYRKLCANTRSQAVEAARRIGLLTDGVPPTGP